MFYSFIQVFYIYLISLHFFTLFTFFIILLLQAETLSFRPRAVPVRATIVTTI